MVKTENKNLRSGFSFLEMMVMLVVIGLIIGFVGPRLMGLLGRGRTTATKNTLKVVNDAVQTYKYDTGKYPSSLEELNNNGEDVSGYQGPYLPDKYTDTAPQDSWGEDLVYEKKGRGEKPPYELYSLGDPDKDDDRIQLS